MSTARFNELYWLYSSQLAVRMWLRRNEGGRTRRHFSFPLPSFLRSLASLISLCWCHMLNHRKWEHINQTFGTLADRYVWCWLVKATLPLLPVYRKKNVQAGTWKCQHVEVWQARSHNSCPCSTQSILSIRPNEKQSGKDQQLGADLRAPALYCSLSYSSLQSRSLWLFSMWPYLPIEQSDMKQSSIEKLVILPVYHFEQHSSVRASGIRLYVLGKQVPKLELDLRC